MFDYFDIENIDTKEIVDIWKKMDFSEIVSSDKYQFHILNENENLMDISWKYYGNIEDWWCIYLFNQLYDINFDILQPPTVLNTQDYYIFNLSNYTQISDKDKGYLQYVVRNYYRKDYPLLDSIKLTNDRLSTLEKRTDIDFLNNFKVYIYDYLVDNSWYRIQLKIPDSEVVYLFKNKMENYRIIWNQ